MKKETLLGLSTDTNNRTNHKRFRLQKMERAPSLIEQPSEILQLIVENLNTRDLSALVMSNIFSLYKHSYRADEDVSHPFWENRTTLLSENSDRDTDAGWWWRWCSALSFSSASSAPRRTGDGVEDRPKTLQTFVSVFKAGEAVGLRWEGTQKVRSSPLKNTEAEIGIFYERSSRSRPSFCQ